jgi:hypothetical protein
MPDTISFVTRLTEAEWDEVIGGWRCPALQIPGANVQRLYVEGSQIDSGNYQVLQSQFIIRWILPKRPERIAVVIELSEALTLEADASKWRRRAIILPVLATIGAALITALPTYWSKIDSTQWYSRPQPPKPAAYTSPNNSQIKAVDDNRIPRWVPRYPGANIENVSFQGNVGSFSFKCPDDEKAVFAFFDSRLRVQGMQTRNPTVCAVCELTASNNDALKFVLKQTGREEKGSGWTYRYGVTFSTDPQ